MTSSLPSLSTSFVGGSVKLAELARILESVALFRGLKTDGSLAKVLTTLGKIMQAQGDAAAAYGALTETLRLAQAVGPRLFVAASMEGLASVVAEQGKADLTVRLLSATAMRVQIRAPAWPADQVMVNHALAGASSMIGADNFAAVWAEA
jgi:hypothetical protein